MTFLDNVRGCVLNINKFHSSIPFTSSSDALFASLFFKHKDSLELQLLDDLLSLFQHPNFHSGEVTFKEAEDILVHVADHRQAIMTMRNTKDDIDRGCSEPSSTTHSRAWKLVLELVAEYLDSERVPFHLTRTNEFGPKVCDVNRTFAVMSLVHRSWAEVAQRYCRRRIDVQIVRGCGLQSLLQNPAAGPWVQELNVIGGSSESGGWEERTHNMLQVPRLLSKFLRRCPNIKQLRLNTHFYARYTADNRPLRDIVHSIGTLRHLKSLWMGEDCGLGLDDIKKLMMTISKLQNLSTLGLESSGWRSFEKATNLLNLTEMPQAPASLTASSLIHTNNITTSLMTWIMNPDYGCRVTRLEISLRDMLENVDGVKILRSAIESCATEHVTKLQLIVDAHEEDVSLVLRLFPSLKTLSLYVNMEQERSLIVLPVSITELIFCFTSYYDQSFDAYVLATIKANPYVRKFSFTYIPWTIGSAPGLEENFEESINYASKNNVDLKVFSTEIRPHFLDM